MNKLEAVEKFIFLVKQIPDDRMEKILAMVEDYMKEQAEHRMTDEEYQAYLDNVSEEDEELTEEELQVIEESRKAIRDGKVVSFDDAAEELGI